MRYRVTDQDMKNVLTIVKKFPGIQTPALLKKLERKMSRYDQRVWSILECLKFKFVSAERDYGGNCWEITAEGVSFLTPKHRKAPVKSKPAKKVKADKPTIPRKRKGYRRSGPVTVTFIEPLKPLEGEIMKLSTLDTPRVQMAIDVLHCISGESGEILVAGGEYHARFKVMFPNDNAGECLNMGTRSGYIERHGNGHKPGTTHTQVCFSINEEFLADNPLDVLVPNPPPDPPDNGNHHNLTIPDEVAAIILGNGMPKYAKSVCVFAVLAYSRKRVSRKMIVKAMTGQPLKFSESYANEALNSAQIQKYLERADKSVKGSDGIWIEGKPCKYTAPVIRVLERCLSGATAPAGDTPEPPDEKPAPMSGAVCAGPIAHAMHRDDGSDVAVMLLLPREHLGRELRVTVGHDKEVLVTLSD